MADLAGTRELFEMSHRLSRMPVVRANAVLLGCVATCWIVGAAAAQPSFVQNGKAGFVISDIKYALGDGSDSAVTCPHGLSKNVVEIYAQTPEGKRRKGEAEADYGKRLEQGARPLSAAPDGQNVCLNPEAAQPDPNYRTLDVTTVRAQGIDLDGEDSSLDRAAAGVCPHQDFTGVDGERGVDNQFYRTVGCNRSYLPTGQSNGFAIEMLTGAWGILITLSGVDDIRNDDDVEVGLFANADPIQLSPTRDPLAYATYAIDQDPHYRAKTHGRIKDGVLTTDPVDVRFHSVTNSLRVDRPLKRARLKVTLSESGVIEGYLAGYTPVEDLYDLQFGFRDGKDGAGKLGPLPLRMLTSNGAARVLGYTCPGAYYSLYKNADGDPDPKAGRCTSISTQYRVKAIPAFVVDVATQSVNTKLSKVEAVEKEPK